MLVAPSSPGSCLRLPATLSGTHCSAQAQGQTHDSRAAKDCAVWQSKPSVRSTHSSGAEPSSTKCRTKPSSPTAEGLLHPTRVRRSQWLGPWQDPRPAPPEAKQNQLETYVSQSILLRPMKTRGTNSPSSIWKHQYNFFNLNILLEYDNIRGQWMKSIQFYPSSLASMTLH